MASKAIATLGVVVLVIGLVQPSLGQILLSKLGTTLDVTGSPTEGETLYAGEDKITVSWSLIAGSDDSTYKKIKLLLCYAPVSQKDRGWRKTVDNLQKDKTCQFKIAAKPYTATGSANYTIERSIPTATYFIRAYALDDSDNQLAYGQTTDKEKKTFLFNIEGISGRTKSIDVAAGVFSAFSIAALIYFFIVEKRKRH